MADARALPRSKRAAARAGAARSRDGMSDAVNIRRELRPGDRGEIVALHGRLYAREYGVDGSFEGFVASSVARAAIRGWPSDQEGVWLVEEGGTLRGCIGYTDEGGGVAMLRWFVLDPSLRGRGLGRRLVRELIAEAEAKGFARIHLETFSDLQAAAHIYREHGFKVTSAESGPRWGRDEITYQHYELELRPRNPEIEAPRALAGGA